jgi:hypothetical protein
MVDASDDVSFAAALPAGRRPVKTAASIALGLWTTLVCPAVDASRLDLPFTLTKPAGDGPFPAVVMMHDCSGLGPRSSGAPWRWSSQLTARGFVSATTGGQKEAWADAVVRVEGFLDRHLTQSKK